MARGSKVIFRFVLPLAFGALAAKTAVINATDLDGSLEQGVKIKDMWLALTYTGKTATEGPVLYGLARNLASVTTLKECLENDPQGQDNDAEMEKSTRDVMVLGWLGQAETGADSSWFQGMRKIRFPWKTIREGSSLQMWAYNQDSTILTTGGSLTGYFIINGEWMLD